MKLEEIYELIADGLKTMERFLEVSIKESKNRSIRAMSDSLLESSGKRLRPALVILSEKAASAGKKSNCNHDELENSDYKRSLNDLTDYIAQNTF